MWAVVDCRDDWALRVDGQVIFPWGVADLWGVVIGRFDRRDHAEAVVAAQEKLARIADLVADERAEVGKDELQNILMDTKPYNMMEEK
jgi:hypothetical protein